MKPITQDWLKEQSQNTDIDPAIREDLLAMVSNGHANGTSTGYLQARTGTISVSGTNGKWDRKKQEKKFTYSVDGDFENWNTVGKNDKPTATIKAQCHDLIKDGMYSQIIPDEPVNFFQNATQALQVIHDNQALADEVLQNDKRIHLPFVNADGDKFVANVFKHDGRLGVYVLEFSNVLVWLAEFGYVFVFPLQVTQ